MALIGVAFINSINNAGATGEDITIEFRVASVSGDGFSDTLNTEVLAPGALVTTINDAVRSAAKARLNGELLDTVRLLNPITGL